MYCKEDCFFPPEIFQGCLGALIYGTISRITSYSFELYAMCAFKECKVASSVDKEGSGQISLKLVFTRLILAI